MVKKWNFPNIIILKIVHYYKKDNKKNYNFDLFI